MVNTEFWYAEVGSPAEGTSWSGRRSQRWWISYPRVPASGLSNAERRKSVNQGKLVHQVFKAVKAINENLLFKMSIPSMITDALPKTGKASLGEELYRVLTSDSKLNSKGFLGWCGSYNFWDAAGCIIRPGMTTNEIIKWLMKLLLLQCDEEIKTGDAPLVNGVLEGSHTSYRLTQKTTSADISTHGGSKKFSGGGIVPPGGLCPEVD